MKKPTRVEARDYLQMTKERPGDTRREEGCFAHLLSAIPAPVSGKILETFGGIGLFRSVAESLGLFGPETEHECWDFSADCVAHLRAKFPGSVVCHVDSFAESVPPGLVLLSADFNTWTFLKYQREEAYKKMTDRLFDAEPEWLQLTDSAVNKLHLNYRSYAKALGLKDAELVRDPEGYIQSVAYSFADRGYGLRAAAYHNGAAYYLFQRDAEPGPVHVLRVR